VKDNVPSANRRIEFAGAAVMAAFAILVMVTVYLTMPLFDPVYLLGPGLFPFALGVLLLAACVVLFVEIRSGRHDAPGMRALFDKTTMRRPLALMALLAVTLLLLPLLGFLISLFFFSFVEMHWLERDKRSWWVNAIYAAALAGGVNYLIDALTMQLPQPFWM
jgi:hypothetical protein